MEWKDILYGLADVVVDMTDKLGEKAGKLKEIDKNTLKFPALRILLKY